MSDSFGSCYSPNADISIFDTCPEIETPSVINNVIYGF